jgi:hypothetical protein
MVIAGLDPAIHEATPRAQPQGNTARNLIMDARVKPAHDESKIGAAGINLCELNCRFARYHSRTYREAIWGG